MNAEALFTRWDIPWAVTCALMATAAIYVRGFIRIRRTRPAEFPYWRCVCFCAGIAAIFVAVASPLDAFADRMLSIHMVQHFFLWSVAPILAIFGAPVAPMLRGLPGAAIRALRPLFAAGVLHHVGGFLTRLRVAWLIWTLSFVIWHIPAMYDQALASETVHECEHACFFFASLIFWWPVIAPWPFRRPGFTRSGDSRRWMLIPYLLLADVVNTAVSALLCFSGRVLYPGYLLEPRLFGLSALNDQIAAGAFMWVSGSMMYLIPAMAITMHLLAPRARRPAVERMAAAQRSAQ